MTKFAYILIINAVPGLTASQLQVKDTGLCTTFDDFYGLWIDPFRFVDIGCAQKELE